MRKLANLIHRPDEPDAVWMRIRFGGSLPTSFTGRASRPGAHATCVAQRGRCPELGEPRPFAHGDGLHGGTGPECNHHEYALEFCAGSANPSVLGIADGTPRGYTAQDGWRTALTSPPG